MDDGHDEPRVRRGGDPDIVVLLVYELVGLLVDGAIEGRVSHEGVGHRLDDERQERELDPAALCLRRQPLSHLHEPRSVALLDEGEVRSGGRGLAHPLGDLTTYADDRLASLARSIGLVLARLHPNGGAHVVAGDPTAAATRPHMPKIDPHVFGKTPSGRSRQRLRFEIGASGNPLQAMFVRPSSARRSPASPMTSACPHCP